MANDNPRTVKITEALTQFIALDDQLLSVTDNVGFWRLLNVLELKYNIPSHTHIRHHLTKDTRLRGKKKVYCTSFTDM